MNQNFLVIFLLRKQSVPLTKRSICEYWLTFDSHNLWVFLLNVHIIPTAARSNNLASNCKFLATDSFPGMYCTSATCSSPIHEVVIDLARNRKAGKVEDLFGRFAVETDLYISRELYFMTFFGNFSSNESIIFTNSATKSVTGNSITLRRGGCATSSPAPKLYTSRPHTHFAESKSSAAICGMWQRRRRRAYKAFRIRDRAIIKRDLIRDQTDMYEEWSVV